MIKSEAENQFVYDLLRNTSGEKKGWIGMHRKADNKFYWLDSRPEKGNFKNWGKGKRSKSPSNENCVVIIIRSEKAGEWNDLACSDTGAVAICQWPI